MRSVLRLFCLACIVATAWPLHSNAQLEIAWEVVEPPSGPPSGMRFFGVSGGRLYYQTFNGGLVESPASSTDGGWSAVISPAALDQTIVSNFMTIHGGVQIVMTTQGNWRRQNQAGTFARYGGPINGDQLNNDFRDITIAASGTWYAATAIGVVGSSDQGRSWVRIFELEFVTRVRALPDGSLLAAVSRAGNQWGPTQAAGIWHSSPNRKDWVGDLFPNDNVFTIHDMEVSSEGRWYITAIGGGNSISYSDDEGATWERTGFGDASQELILLDDGNILAAGTSSGVAYSTDGGQTWPRYNDGLLNNGILFMGVNIDGHAFCADRDGTMYRSTYNFINPSTAVAEDKAIENSINWLSDEQILTVNTNDESLISQNLLLEIFDIRGLRLQQHRLRAGMGLRDFYLGGLPSGALVVRVTGQNSAHSLLLIN